MHRSALVPAGDDAADRAWGVEAACLHCAVLVEDGDDLRPGPGVLPWASDDARTRTWFRAFTVVAAAEEVVRGLPGSSYLGEQVSSRLAEAVAAAAGPQPVLVSDLESREGVLDRYLLEPEVHRGLERLRWLGLLADGPVLAAPPHGEALLQTLARALEEMPVPQPRHPDSLVTGPTYEVEASVEVRGARRTRLVRISGSSRVSVLTHLLMTVFGLRAEGRTSRLTGAPLSPWLGEPGLLTASGADRKDPWTLAVGHVEHLEDPDRGNALVSATGVTVASLVEHLGDRWELALHTSHRAVVEDPVLRLRLVRTVSAEDSRGLAFPSCLAGEGNHLAAVDEVDDDGEAASTGDPFDLVAVERQVSRIHRDGR